MSTVKPPKAPQIKTDDSNCFNLLAKNFNQPAPNLVWVCDFTYIRVANRFYYLCAILDLFARKIVSFKLSSRINTQLAMDTLNIALSTRGDVSGLMFHTDRGSQFTSKKFRQHLDSLNAIHSGTVLFWLSRMWGRTRRGTRTLVCHGVNLSCNVPHRLSQNRTVPT